MIRRSFFAPTAAFVALTSACGFLFTRLDDIPPGSVVGRTVDIEDTVLRFSRIGLEATPRVGRALDDGTFRVDGLVAGQWLLRFSSDDDGDGAPEQAAIRALRIVEGIGPDGDQQLSAVLLGDVALDGTGEIVGRSVDEGGAPVAGARVIVFRNQAELDAEQLVGAVASAIDLGAEQETASAVDGTFRLAGVARGAVRLAAVDASGERVSAVTTATVQPGRSADVADIVLATGGTRPAQVDVQNPPDDGSLRVDVIKHGGDRRLPGDVLATHTVPAGPSIGGFDVPMGIVDIYVTDVDGFGAERRFGVMTGRVVPRGTEALVWGSVELSGDDPCGDATDRDRDGRNALPDPAIDAAPWSACSSTCAAAFGTVEPATCEVDGERFDCDDDEDGQPDVTEPFACVSLCGGTDLDGDGACAPLDAFPQCAENDAAAAACSAEAHAFVPPPSLYGGAVSDGCTGSGGVLVPIALLPASNWTLDHGGTGVLECDDPNNPANIGSPNPVEQSFAEEGDGVALFAQSTSAVCCTCTERVLTVPMNKGGVTDAVALVGRMTTSFSGTFAQANAYARVLGDGDALNAYLKTEDRPNNNCLNTPPQQILVDNGGCFSIPLLSSFVTAVEVHVQGYACADGSADVHLDELALERAEPAGEGEGEGEGEGAVFRSLVLRELTAEPLRVQELSTAISANGALAAYSTFSFDAVRIVTVPVDGSAAPTEVDSFVPGCCGADIALNEDGTVLAWSNGADLEVLDISGGAAGALLGQFRTLNGFIRDIALDDVGNVYFYVVREDATATGPLERGVYRIDAGTSVPVALATVAQVSTQLGITTAEVFGYGNAGPTLGVSGDGTRLIFGVFAATATDAGDALLSLTLPAGTLATLIARVGAAQTAGPGLRHASLSRDGSTVVVEVGNVIGQVNPSAYRMMAFDGSNAREVAAQPPAAAMTNSSPMHVSADGTLFLLGDPGHLYRDDGSFLELPVRGGFFSNDPPAVSDGAVWVMDASGTHFLCVDADASNIAQLVSLTLGTTLAAVGDAPTITAPTLSALELPRDGVTALTLSAGVQGQGIVRVSSAMLFGGLRDTSGNSLNAEVVLSDDDGDGVFSSAAITANPGTVLGVREVRVKAESSVGGRRRASAVDFARLNVVE